MTSESVKKFLNKAPSIEDLNIKQHLKNLKNFNRNNSNSNNLQTNDVGDDDDDDSNNDGLQLPLLPPPLPTFDPN